MSIEALQSLHKKRLESPTLSLILCSRNDQYMGNSRWRLETTLNYVAQRVHELGRENEVEVMVADWGSEIPLSEALQLSPAASRIVSFLLIPPTIARDLQRDSPFPEVLALNAAARRASGEYIGRIDQDTLVGKRFLEIFFDLYEGRKQLEVPPESALLFSNRRSISFRFAVLCPSYQNVERFVRWFGPFLHVETFPPQPFYTSDVGIWLLHRSLWDECSGYDERMIYMNDMEINMIVRLSRTHPMIDFGKLVNYDFYHLDHYHPWGSRSSSTHRIVNPPSAFSQPQSLHPNTENWGLAQYKLVASRGRTSDEVAFKVPGKPSVLLFVLIMLRVVPLIVFDEFALPVRAIYLTWRHRAHLVWQTISDQPFLAWPSLLKKLWIAKTSARNP